MGTMGDEEIQITEAPEHTDARHSAVLRRHHVHIAVANVNRPVSVGVQLAQGFVHGIRSRFLPDILTLSYRATSTRSPKKCRQSACVAA